MATGLTPNYNLSYPLSTDPVNVASDIEDLAKDLDSFLTTPIFINDLRVDGGDITTTAITATVFNSNATTLDIGGAATSINLGSATGTATIKNTSVVLDGDLQIKGGDITTNQTTFNIINTDATTVNIAGAATTLNIGNTSGQTNFAGDVNVATGKQYEINNVSVLTSNTLGSGVVNSSLTSVGTITSGTWEGTTIAVNKGGTGVTESTGTLKVVLSESPTLTGIPMAPTAAFGTDTDQIATTAFVALAVADAGSGTIVYQPTAPTVDLEDGVLWVDSDGEAEMLNANDYYNKSEIDQLLSGAGLNAFFLMGA